MIRFKSICRTGSSAFKFFALYLIQIDLAHYEEKMMQKSQSDIRIRLNEAEDEDLEDEEYDEDLDEDCLNRRHVK